MGIDKNNHVAFESGWGTNKYSLSSDGNSWSPVGFIYGSGGGVSNQFARPAYQDGVVSQSSRVVPDLSADGDVSTGMRIGLTQDFGAVGGGVEYGEYRIGGTSLSSPLLAGMIALADQAAHAQGKGNVGFANPAIYQLYNSKSAGIRDVVHHDGSYVRNDYVNSVNNNDGYSYSVRTVDQDTSLKTTAGYDMVTGVGTPTGSFYAALAALAPPA
jgi:subtilase family serine protease